MTVPFRQFPRKRGPVKLIVSSPSATIGGQFRVSASIATNPSSWKQPVNQPLRARVLKRQQPHYCMPPMALPRVTYGYPDAPAGIEVGGDQTGGPAYATAQNLADKAILNNHLTQRRIRISIPSWDDATGISNMRTLALLYKSDGYFVSYGITGNSGVQNSTTYASWKAQVPGEALWAHNNGIDRFYIGNEEDWQAQGGHFGTVTDATVRTDVLAMAVTLKAAYPTMEIVYSTAQGTVSQWNTKGTGSLDKLGFNMYDTLDNFGPNITFFMSQIGAKFFVSEWGANNGYADSITLDGYTDSMYANDLASRYATLRANNLESYFFALRYGGNTRTSGNWNILDNLNVPLPGFEQVFGAFPLFVTNDPSFWNHPTQQPLRNRIPKRQQPMPRYDPWVATTTVVTTPSVASYREPISQPIRNRTPKRQQPQYQDRGRFLITGSATATIGGQFRVTQNPATSLSWGQPDNQPLRSRVLKRQQPFAINKRFLITANNASTISGQFRVTENPANIPGSWLQAVNQPLRSRVPKRQQPFAINRRFLATSSASSTISGQFRVKEDPARIPDSWLQPANQPLRHRWIKRQQPPVRTVIPPFGTGLTDVFNGTFESAPPFTAPQTGNGWVDGTAGGSGNVTWGWNSGGVGTVQSYFDTAVPYSGQYAFKASLLGVGSYIETKNVPGYDTPLGYPYRLALVPGQTYTLSFRMKTNYVSGDSSSGAFICLLTADAWGRDTLEYSSTAVKTTTGWTKYTMTFTAGANIYSGHVEMRIYGHTGAGTLVMDAWWDNITFAADPVGYIEPVNQPLRARTPKRQQPFAINKRFLVSTITNSTIGGQFRIKEDPARIPDSWLQPANQPLKARVPKRQQPFAINKRFLVTAGFLSTIGGQFRVTSDPSKNLSSWKQPVQAPLRSRVPKRLQPQYPFFRYLITASNTATIGGQFRVKEDPSRIPDSWLQAVNQPLRARVSKRQMPQYPSKRYIATVITAATIGGQFRIVEDPSKTPDSWLQPVNQPLRSRVLRRQQPFPINKRFLFASASFSTIGGQFRISENPSVEATWIRPANEPFKSRTPIPKRQYPRIPLYPGVGFRPYATNFNFENHPVYSSDGSVVGLWIDGTSIGNTGTPYGWAITALSFTGAGAAFDTSIAHSGTTSMRLSQGSSASNVAVSTFRQTPTSGSLPTEAFVLQPNRQYVVSGYIRTNNVLANSAFIEFQQYNAAGTQIATTSSVKMGAGTNSGWTFVTIVVTTGATAAYGGIVLHHDVQGNVSDVWYDDISVTQGGLVFQRPTNQPLRNRVPKRQQPQYPSKRFPFIATFTVNSTIGGQFRVVFIPYLATIGGQFRIKQGFTASTDATGSTWGRAVGSVDGFTSNQNDLGIGWNNSDDHRAEFTPEQSYPNPWDNTRSP